MPLLNGPTEFGSKSPLPKQFTTNPKKIARQGDLLFCVRGSTTGRMNWADQEYAIGRGIGAIRHKRDAKLNPLLRAVIEWRLPHLLAGATGSTFPNVSQQMLCKLAWPRTIVGREHEISGLLESIDDRKELNLQKSATLEEMARAVYRDWFVDFGPVRRKMGGATDSAKILGGLVSDQAQADDMAALFPHALSPEGIPVGWSVEILEEVLTLAYGKALPKPARIEGRVPVYGSGGIGGWHTASLAEGPGIIVGRKGTVGSLFWEPSDFYAIDTVFYVQPKAGYSLEYLWQLLGTLGLEKMNTDAAVPGLNRNNAYRLEIVSSDQPVRDAFTELAGLLRTRIDVAERETRTLNETRDYLLPRLMSGRVEIAGEPKVSD